MTTYTIHLARRAATASLEDVVAAPDSFSWAAFLFGPLWLAGKRMFGPLALWCLAAAALAAFARLSGGHVTGGAAGLAALAFEFWFGFEANELHRRALERSGRRALDLVVARDRGDAIAQFFRRRLAGDGLADSLPVAPRAAAVAYFGLFGEEQAP